MTKPRISMLLQLFWTFSRVGPSTFGGGYAMIPIIERETVEKRKWLDEQEMSDMLSVAGSAPGGVGVNASAFIGYRLAGLPGAVAAILGITLPTFLIVLGLALVYRHIDGNPKVEAAMQGIRGAILALILVSAYKMAKTSLFDKTTAVILIAALALLTTTALNPFMIILGGIAGGIACAAAKQLLGLRMRTEKERPAHDAGDPFQLEYYI
ncbi:chromate transporter [Paenibacillus nasutitermitis]|uniref:Chromate transporter n=1 Tax=Paenibacillus nasutitermitis TaxID=1652958 RepID=A0A917DY44_9BACL|nr:chromate transporter [Paenibacillus nasutitermitis]GGD78610.1 chromate transporter [Paenibacillus nasutitermitis]